MWNQWAGCLGRETSCPKWIKGMARQRDMSIESRGLALSCTCWGWGAVARQRKPPQNSASQAVTTDTKPRHYGLGFLGSLSPLQCMWSYTGPQQQLFLFSDPSLLKDNVVLCHMKSTKCLSGHAVTAPLPIHSLVCIESYKLDVAGQEWILREK